MKIGICGYYGLGNSGDEAILAGMVKGLRALDPEVEIVVFSQNPAHTERVHGLPAVWMPPFGVRWLARSLLEGRLLTSLKALWDIDGFILGGGGFLADWQREAILTWLNPAWLAGLLGKKRVLYAVGAGPITTRLGRMVTSTVLNGFDLLSVRDETSKEWLLRCGVRKAIAVVPDPAILVERASEERVAEVLAEEGLDAAEGPWVAMCVAPFFHEPRLWPGQLHRYEKLKEDLVQVTEFIVRQLNARVVFVPMQPAVDGPLSTEVASRLAPDMAGRVQVVGGALSPRDVIGLLDQATLTVGMRLHALILSAAAGTPCVGVAYHHKSRDFLRAIGTERFVPLGDGRLTEDTDLDVPRLCELIQETWECREAVALEIEAAVSDLKARSRESFTEVYEVLRRGQRPANQEPFYEAFHSAASLQPRVIRPDNFTYRAVIAALDRYLGTGMRVLDIGCGLGALSFYMASKGNQVVGIDISERAIQSCRASAQSLGLADRTCFEAVDFISATFEGPFHLILCSEVLEHLPDDYHALAKIHDLLSPGGVVILSVPSANAPVHRLRLRLFGHDAFDERVGHLRRYTSDELTTKVEAAGLRVVESWGTEGALRNFLYVTRPGNLLLRLVRLWVCPIVTTVDSVFLKLLGESQIFVVAIKEVIT